jgi:hypothetical protein
MRLPAASNPVDFCTPLLTVPVTEVEINLPKASYVYEVVSVAIAADDRPITATVEIFMIGRFIKPPFREMKPLGHSTPTSLSNRQMRKTDPIWIFITFLITSLELAGFWAHFTN